MGLCAVTGAIQIMDWIIWVIKYLLGAALGAATGAIGVAVSQLHKRQKTQQDEQTAIKDGLLALMHDRIYSCYAECKIKRYATIDDIKNLECLYRPYHTLGGNGTGTELYERIKSMPDKPDARKDVAV